ncbi:hypothetical protein NKH77_48930 [Streptomyces sp. M19]
MKVAEFRRIAGRAVLVVVNKHQRATGGPAAVRAGAESFARSVGGPRPSCARRAGRRSWTRPAWR